MKLLHSFLKFRSNQRHYKCVKNSEDAKKTCILKSTQDRTLFVLIITWAGKRTPLHTLGDNLFLWGPVMPTTLCWLTHCLSDETWAVASMEGVSVRQHRLA